ncbi:protocatechuate 3,4-dioxygenase beta subunit [Chitinivorax tropicus]|uniref:Protocatechuate 3,4-dioxygenase beta subunit n=1 Tax=Chitinivorax tropicus TaxID=714531 RepID=A0A840MNN6_9PROT|nr:Ig-like domain-containing protein [Chitinivorax tropicus]MBB5020050.1 protocatechuate 3,4-dioxygenase beta subunit [Chitinivorax tropicus]
MKTSFVPRILQHALLAASSLAFVALTACSGGGGGGSTTPPPPATPQVAKLSIATVADTTTNQPKNSVKTDNSDSLHVVVTALDANNVAVKDAVVQFSSGSGEIQATTTTTDATGKISAKFSTGLSAESKFNRTETISVVAPATNVKALVPVDIVGTTLTMKLATGSSTSVPSGGNAGVVVSVRDAGGKAITNAAVSISSTGTGSVTSNNTVNTDANGDASLSVTGANAGATTVVAKAAGASGSLDLTVTGGTGGFAFTQPASNTIIAIGSETEVAVAVPGAGAQTTVVFAASTGAWKNTDGTWTNKSVISVPVVGGAAKATFKSAASGAVTIDAYRADQVSSRANLTLAVGTGNTNNATVVLQASPASVAVSTDTKKNSVLLSARVTDPAGNPVLNAPVSFSIVKSTSSGESVGPTIAFTDATGVATTTFTSGSQPGKVTLNADIVGGVGVKAGPVDIDVGGQAASIGFAQDTKLAVKDIDPNYYLAMSVHVVDGKGNPVPGAKVTLSVNPIYFSTGSGCAITNNYITEWPSEKAFLKSLGLDLSLNGEKDPVTGAVTSPGLWRGVKYDLGAASDVPDAFPGQLTPTNGNVGSVPGEVVTESDGKVNFTYSYPKSSALWHVVRISARTMVAGSEATTNYVFRLSALESDVKPCRIPDSPYTPPK